MKQKYIFHLTLALVLLAGLAACQPQPASEPAPTLTPLPPSPEAQPSATPIIRGDPTPEPEPEPEETPSPPYGPDEYPADVNPLTGLPVDDPAVLLRAPLLIKVSNESNDVRPQSGLSFADHVWMSHMEGFSQTRFTAIYYGQAPEFVGSVRSVRLIDTDYLLSMYDGLLIISGGSIGMNTIWLNAPWRNRVFHDDGEGYLVRLPDIPREFTDYYHRLFALPEKVWEAADERGVNNPPDLRGLRFDITPPPGGTATSEMSIDYPRFGPKQTWRYDADSGRWLSWTEIQIVLERQSTPDMDYHTGEQLAFDNVVIVYSEYYLADFIEDEPSGAPGVGPVLQGEGDAVVLRDGRRYDVTWRVDDPEQMIRFYGPDGEPFPLRPGTTWFHSALVSDFRTPPEVEFLP